MTEMLAPVGSIELCYESFGDPSDPLALLIVGIGTQLVEVPEGFCRMLASRGFRVVRFDNRDVGRSTILSDVPPPSIWQLVMRDHRAGAYSLADLADDAVGLLDVLEVESAHFVGASLGGMIAQVAAVRHPARVGSLTSIMSSTGQLLKGRPSLRFLRYMLPSRSISAEQTIARRAARIRARGSMREATGDGALRTAQLSHTRNSDTAGARRQLLAMLAAGDRRKELAYITAPTLVIHGTADRFVGVSGAHATVRAIPGARLQLIEGMAHDLPGWTWEAIAGGIVDNASRSRKDRSV
jgi:pimeloyl-ACP methyl ester carboxylesterase